jgi:hypothetical protein
MSAHRYFDSRLTRTAGGGVQFTELAERQATEVRLCGRRSFIKRQRWVLAANRFQRRIW